MFITAILLLPVMLLCQPDEFKLMHKQGKQTLVIPSGNDGQLLVPSNETAIARPDVTDENNVYTDKLAQEIFGDDNRVKIVKASPGGPSPNLTDNETIRWDNGINFGKAGITGGGIFDVAAYFPASTMAQYTGMKLNQVEIYIGENPISCELKVYGPGTSNSPGTLLQSQPVTTTPNSWNLINLLNQVDITGQDLWISYSLNHLDGTSPVGIDEGPAIAGYGDMISFNGGSWYALSSMGYNYNWNIAGYLEEGEVLCPTVYAGPDATICESSIFYTLADAIAIDYSWLQWTTSGDGLFENSMIQNPSYFPGSGDYANGSVELCLTGYPIEPCTVASMDCMELTIVPLPTVDVGEDISVCDNTQSVTVEVVATNYSFIEWSSSCGFFSDPSATVTEFFPFGTTEDCEICVTVYPINPPCVTSSEDCLTLNFIPGPAAYAGNDVIICEGDIFELGEAYANNYSTVEWTSSGDGAFSDSSTINPVYTPGLEDIANGWVGLNIEATPLPGCNNSAFGSMGLTIVAPPNFNMEEDVWLDCDNYNYSTYDWLPIDLCPEGQNISAVQWTSNGDGYFDNANALCTIYNLGDFDQCGGEVELTIQGYGPGDCGVVAYQIITLHVPGQLITIPSDGWTGISSYINKYSSSVPDVLDAVKWQLDSIKDVNGRFYEPLSGINQIGNWKPEGYVARFTNQACLPVYGNRLTNQTFAVHGPETYLPVLTDVPVNIDDLMADHLDDIFLILCWQTGSIWSPGPEYDVLETLLPGCAYLLQTTDANVNFEIQFPPYQSPCEGSVPDHYSISGHVTIAGNNTSIPLENVSIHFTDSVIFTNSSGHYSMDVPVEWSGTVTPSKDGLTFEPVNRNYSNISWYKSDQDFLAMPNCPTANAGDDVTICENESIQLNGQAENYTSLLWETSGDGTFADSTALDSIYYPGTFDIANGNTELCLTAFAEEPCEDGIDCLLLTITKNPIANAGDDQTIAENESVALDATAQFYSTIQWSTSGDGVFVPSDYILSPVYEPGTEDCANCYVELCLTAYPINPCVVSATDCMILHIFTEPPSTEPLGSGTSEDPYLIASLENLYWLAVQTNAGNTFDGKFFLQTADIDASETQSWFCGLGWIPIGTTGNSFWGSYDGGCNTIESLYISRPNESNIGLFGYVRGSGTRLEKLRILNANITGEGCVGGLAGRLRSYAEVAYVDVENIIINLSDLYGGGLVGVNYDYASIYRCSSSGQVHRGDSSSYNYVGGFIGGIGEFATVDECYSTTEVTSLNNRSIGGFAGLVSARGEAKNSYSRGSVNAAGERVGGFCGDLGNGTISNCFSTGLVYSPFYYVGGFNGKLGSGVCLENFWDIETSNQSTSSCATGETTAEMKTVSTFTDEGWDFEDVWAIDGITNDGYPALKWQLAPLVDAGVDATISEGSDYTLMAVALNYSSIQWSTPNGDGTFDPDNTIISTYFPDPLDYGKTITLCITVQAIHPCGDSVTDCMTLTIEVAPYVDAGPDDTICVEGGKYLQKEGAYYQLYGSTNLDPGEFDWITYSDGTFDDPFILNPKYYYGVIDILNGSVTLTISEYPPKSNSKELSDSMILTLQSPPTVYAGADTLICCGDSYTIADALASDYSGLQWFTLNGTGAFDDETLQNPTYFFGPGDCENDSVVLCVNANPIDPCVLAAEDCMIIYLQNPPIANAGEDQTYCCQSYNLAYADAMNHASLLWTTSGDGTFNDSTILHADYYPGPIDRNYGNVELCLTAYPVYPCVDTITDCMTLTIYPYPQVALGPDTAICGCEPFMLPQAGALHYSQLLWSTSGTGTFSQYDILHPVYYPSTEDCDFVGSVELCLSADGIPPCAMFASDCIIITFYPLPEMDCPGDFSVCIDEPPFALTGATPAGGAYSGPGVSNGNFNAQSAGEGTHPITYTYTDENGCTDSCTFQIGVVPLPQIWAGNDATICEDGTYVFIEATAVDYSQLIWETDGTGVFNDPTLLNPEYYPGLEDILQGSVEIWMGADPLSPCLGRRSDAVVLSLGLNPTANAGQDDTICCSDVFPLNGLAQNASSIYWTTSGDGEFDDDFSVYSPGFFDCENGSVELCLIAQPIDPCTVEASDCMELFLQPDPTANAGQNDTICCGDSYTLWSAEATNYSSILWVAMSGVGQFDNENIQNPTYLSSPIDCLLDSIALCMMAEPIYPCTVGDYDCMTLNFYPQPVVNCPGDFSVCIDEPPFALSGATPAGGYYLGSGVDEVNFNAQSAGEGTHPITYIYTDENGCSDSCTFEISVAPLPTANAGQDDTICCGDSYTLWSAEAAHYSYIYWFFINGVGQFDNEYIQNPTYFSSLVDCVQDSIVLCMMAGPINPCVVGDYDCMTLYFYPQPDVTCPGDFSVCIDEPVFALSGATPAGGAYSGPGVSNGNFNAQSAGEGTHPITYIYTDEHGCTDSCTFDISVAPLPTANAGEDMTVCCGELSPMIYGEVTNSCGSLWTTSGDGFFDDYASPVALYFPGDGDCATGSVTLYITAHPCYPCTVSTTDNMIITFQNKPTVDAGMNTTICEGSTHAVNAVASDYSSVFWSTSGNGTFELPGLLSTIYTPDPSDYGEYVELCIEALPISPCLVAVTDCMDLFIQLNPTVDAGNDDTLSCEMDTYEFNAFAENYSELEWFTTNGTGTFSFQNTPYAIYHRGPQDQSIGEVVICLEATGIVPCNSVTDCLTLYFYPLPEVNCPNDFSVCIDEPYFELTGANPEGGEYTGSGVLYNNFIAVLAGVGTHPITYTYTDVNGCTDSCTFEISVAPLPTANAGEDMTVCCGELSPMIYGEVSNSCGSLWTTSGDGFFEEFVSPYFLYFPGDDDCETGSVTLFITADPCYPCTTSATDSMTITFQNKPTAIAGTNETICEGDSYTLIEATAANYSELLWVSYGTGYFNDPTILNPVYNLSSIDVLLGNVELCLNAAPISPCAIGVTDCITLTIQLAPTAFAGGDAEICEGDSYELLEATAANYSELLWVSYGTGNFDDPTILNPVYTPGFTDLLLGSVELCLNATPISPCATGVTDCITLTIQFAPTAFAGGDAKICGGDTYELLEAFAANYSELLWLSYGTGNFDDPTILNPVYTPGFTDLLLGSVELCLNAAPISPCAIGVTDCMIITFQPMAEVYAGDDATICEDQTFNLAGVAANYSSLLWSSSGDGMFDNPNTLFPVYTPGIADITTGNVLLTLTASAIEPCTVSASDDIILNIILCAARDYGDAPENGTNYKYPTTRSNNGAVHYYSCPATHFLGSIVDIEYDGQPTANADGDDNDNLDDEDGVLFINRMHVGRTAKINVTASDEGFLNAWMDFNADGDWADPTEQIFTNEGLIEGPQTLTFPIPINAKRGKTFLRFRFNSQGNLPYYGEANDGEVEDYKVRVYPRWWWFMPTYWTHVIEIPSSTRSSRMLAENDLIGVFYTDMQGIEQCAGFVEWNGETQLLTAYGDDPTTPDIKEGFADGESLNWKIYSDSTEIEKDICVSYDPSFPNHDGTFANFGSSALSSISNCQSLIIPQGWSGISSYIIPNDTQVSAMFSPIVNSLTILFNYDGYYWPSQGGNTLGTWNEYSGYAIKLSDTALLCISGTELINKQVNLTTGWNIIPVLSAADVDIENTFAGVSGFYAAKDVAGLGVYWPIFDINTIGNLKTGKSYYVYMVEADSITYSSGGVKTSTIEAATFKNLTPWNDAHSTPGTHLVAFVAEATSGFQTGDILGAFTQSGLCAGMNVYSGNGFSLMLNTDDVYTVDVDGFASDEIITYKLYRPSTGETFDLEVSYDPSLDNTGKFNTNGFSAISQLKMLATGIYQHSANNIRIYPNPTTGTFNIEGIDKNISIIIFNAFGEEIYQNKLELPSKLDLSTQPKGIYFISIETNNKLFFEKLVIN